VGEVHTLDQVVCAVACESRLQHADIPSRKHLWSGWKWDWTACREGQQAVSVVCSWQFFKFGTR